MTICDGFVGCVGNTPLIKLRALSAETGCNVLGKAEWLNPGGSVKDRAALFLVEDAEARGLLPGGTVVEGTAGNTGIGLAHICSAKGYKLVVFIPDSQSREKADLLRALGAEVRAVPPVPVSDPAHFTFQARNYAASLPNAKWANQFDNTANSSGHYRTTGPEIWAQTAGRLDAFVAATGTGGTLAGITRFLHEQSAGRVQCFLADPPGSALHGYIQSGGKKLERSGASITEGIGQGRVTDNLKTALPLLAGSVYIDDRRTVAMLFRLIKDEGLFVGASSALNVVAAGDIARRLGPGHTVVTMVCDGAYRYQSRLFSRSWLESKGLLDAVPEDCRALVTLE